MDLDTSQNYILNKMKEDSLCFQNYGYDLHIDKVCRKYISEEENLQHHDLLNRIKEIDNYFLEAAYLLTKRGILRNGVNKIQAQSVEDGVGFSLTSFGREWLSKSKNELVIPTDPSKFSTLLSKYKGKFGEGFYQRSNEAIFCYKSSTYLACCTMCGASAESILLAIAIKKNGNEEEILKKYKSASGRKNITDFIVGKLDSKFKDHFLSCNDLLNYWRDESAHGILSDIDDNEAFTSLALLLRFAKICNDNWDLLTKK